MGAGNGVERMTEHTEPHLIRFYYNVRSEHPFIGSVDFGSLTSEIKVRSIACGVPCVSRFDPSPPEGSPAFWMQCHGSLRELYT
jgi:hypothetical protein